MMVVELWKAPQAGDSTEFRTAMRCGIFVPDEESSRAAGASTLRAAGFSESFNKISPACPRVFHSGCPVLCKSRVTPAARRMKKQNGPKRLGPRACKIEKS